MPGFWVRFIITACGLLLADWQLNGMHFGSPLSLLFAALVLGMVNATVRPLMLLLTLPITVLTLGLFILVLNGAMLGLAALLVPGFVIESFWTALFGAIIVSLTAMVANWFIGPKGRVEIIVVAAFTGINLVSSQVWADNFEVLDRNDRLGRIYNYIRSNIDGSNREDIIVFRRDRENIEVYKSRQRCSNAALVTAELDFAMRSAGSITGGRLLAGARHQEFAFLTYDKPASRLDFKVMLPERTLSLDIDIDDGPWHLFDFDLASLTVMTPHLAEVEDGFGFAMPLFWADAEDNPARYLGRVEATYVGTELVGDQATYRFDLTGGTGGAIWLDMNDRHIVLATLDQPNHPGYRDFKLELMSVSDGGLEEWTELLTAHYEGCT